VEKLWVGFRVRIFRVELRVPRVRVRVRVRVWGWARVGAEG
jgi:hypothetical protein